MILTIEAKLINRDTDGLHIGVGVTHNSVHKMLIPEFYIAILNVMRDAHEHEFYEAMTAFIEKELEGKDEV